MARGTAFFHRRMLINERPLLCGVALGAGLILTFQGGTRALNSAVSMDVVTIDTGNFARQHRMRVWQTELTAFIQMALEAGLWGLARINNGALASTRLDVQRATAMARFAPDLGALRVFQRKFGMSRASKMAGLLFVTLDALFRANKSCSGNIRRCHHGAVGDYAANQEKPASAPEAS